MKKSLLVLLIMITSFSYIAQGIDEDLSQSFEQRVNDLTNQIEQINHKYDVLMKKFEALSTDIEFRFKELETKSKAAPIKTADAPKKIADPKSAKMEFEKAYTLIKEQRYDEAEQAFEEFIKSYPTSEYTGISYYWLGESFMLRKRYDKAAVNYIQSFSKFPKNNKADLSMLKLANALNMLSKKKEACTILAKLKVKNDSLSPAMQKLLKKELTQSACK